MKKIRYQKKATKRLKKSKKKTKWPPTHKINRKTLSKLSNCTNDNSVVNVILMIISYRN